MAEESGLTQGRGKRARKLTSKVSVDNSGKRRKKVRATGTIATQSITYAQDNVNSDAHATSLKEPAMLPLQTEQSVSEESEENSDLFEVSLNLPSWWTKGSPRLLATDTPEHVESVVATNFGAGVDLDRYLEPARSIFERFSTIEREEYKKKGLLLMKIPASWKKWRAMENSQKIKFINAIYALNASHAQNIESGVGAIAAKMAKDVEEQIIANRTMHDYARVMHVMSCSDNLAAITKAFRRYTRLELDEAKSKLREDLELSVSGWKQLTVVFNDPNVR